MSAEQFVPEHVETIIVGAGQAGLATAYHLRQWGRACVVIEGGNRVGDVWRNRFDSLRLFTPARYDSLPGLRFPIPRWDFPTGRQMGDYLELYASTLRLPVCTGEKVETVRRDGERYAVTTTRRVMTADHVVVASGTWQRPIVPGFAKELDPSIWQLHSAEYRNPSQLRPGPVLVVGASHSGADIAFELVRSRETYLSGRVHGEIPFRMESRFAHVLLPVIWFAWNHVLTERTPIGRKMRTHIRHGGGPLIRVKRCDLATAGVHHIEARTIGARDGKPMLADGRVLDVANVVWCTGFGKDVDWIDVAVSDDGWPTQIRGVVPSQTGLYFVGLPFLRGFYSMLVGGVSRDAEYVARHIDRHATSPSAPQAASRPAVVEPAGRSA